MPKLLVVSGAEVARALQRLGFVVARQRGSHIVMQRGSSGCVVPNSTLSNLPKAVMPAGKRASSAMDGKLNPSMEPRQLLLRCSTSCILQSWIPAIHAGMTMHFRNLTK